MNENDEFFWLSEFNLKPEVLGENHLPKRLKIYDTTLRDGEQTVGVVFNKDEKLMIAKALDKVGVNRIEAGMPVVSKEDKEAVELILKADLKAEIWGFCRAVKGDIDACADVGIRHIVCEIPTSSYKWKAYHFTQEGVIGKMMESLVYAKSKGIYTAFFAVDATRSDIQVLEMIYKKAVTEGQANEVVIVDTLGVATPETMFYLTKKVREWVPVPVMAHCHNDFGLATACTLFSIKAGADYAQLTINGLGEKTGNADLAETVIASALYGLETNIDLKKICEVSKLVEKISKIKISPLKPVVGKNVFKRESGVAVAQLITYPPSVEGYSPEILGKRREILIGKKSGKSSIEYKLKGMGVSATPEEVEKILEGVKVFANRKKGLVSQKEFVKIVREIKASFTKQK
jgi:isopropylmalate/homocitrate/citramalate synthase